MLNAVLSYNFMQNAVLACFLASIVCGLIGVVVIEKKLVMMGGGIAHTSFGGVGLGYLLGFEPMIGAVLFSLGSAFAIGGIKRRGGVNTDIIIALLWSAGMALGTAFISFMKGYPPDLSSYLFGNILTVTRIDLIIMLVLTLIVFLTITIFFNDWKSFLFDDSFSATLGQKTVLLEYLLLILIALAVVALMRIAGIMLVIALLTAPAATATLISDKLKNRMALAIIFSLVFCFSGLWISYIIGLASGATIVIFSVTSYCVVYLIRGIHDRYAVKTTNR